MVGYPDRCQFCFYWCGDGEGGYCCHPYSVVGGDTGMSCPIDTPVKKWYWPWEMSDFAEEIEDVEWEMGEFEKEINDFNGDEPIWD